MKSSGIIIAILGVFILLGGAGMDTTETARSCVDYDSNYGSGYSCAETEYEDPFPKAAAMTLGFGMLIGGLVVAGASTEDSDSSIGNHLDSKKGNSSSQSSQFEHQYSGSNSSENMTPSEGTFASQLRNSSSSENNPPSSSEESNIIGYKEGDKNRILCPNCGRSYDMSRDKCASCKIPL